MAQKGQNKYVPAIVITELEDLKIEHNINLDHVAMTKMVQYTRVGREIERIMKLDFKHRPTKIKGLGKSKLKF